MAKWKKIDGYKGLYWINENGQIQSRRFGKRRLLKPRISTAGYLFVTLCMDKVIKHYYIHRLVYEYFVGPILPGFIINHEDLNKCNNHISNLNQMTPQANIDHYRSVKKKMEMELEFL